VVFHVLKLESTAMESFWNIDGLGRANPECLTGSGKIANKVRRGIA